MEIENKTISEGGASEPQPVQMPEPAAQPVAPVVESQPMQPPMPGVPEVERMQMPMQPIDLSGQQEMPIQTSGPEAGGKKKMVIIAVVIVAGLLAGAGAFFVWRNMNEPAPEAAMTVEEQPIQPVTVPTTTEQVTAPVAPEADDLSVIENDLNMLNASTIDADLQSGLAEINRSL